MNDEQFLRTLKSVGKTCFVNFFEEFHSNKLSREEIIEKLKFKTEYTERSCISRTGHARRIINAGLAERALEAVVSSSSPKVSEETKEDARKWLKQLNS